MRYVEVDGAMWIISAAAEHKTWWRNLIGGAPVEILLRRRLHQGYATAHTYATNPMLVAEVLPRYITRFPGTTRRLGCNYGDEESLIRTAERIVIVGVQVRHGELDAPDGGSATSRAA